MDLVAAGVRVESRGADLYFPANDETRAILARYPDHKRRARVRVEGTATWIDVPGAYEPWTKLGRR